MGTLLTKPHGAMGPSEPRLRASGDLRECVTSPVHSDVKLPESGLACGLNPAPSDCMPVLPFGGVSSMSFFWQKLAGKMAWEEAW